MTSPSAKTLPTSLTLIGAGKMGGAMLRGWLALGLPPAAVSIIESNPSPELLALCQEKAIALSATAAKPSEVLVLAVKPQGLEAALDTIKAAMSPETLLVSVLAGKTLANLGQRFGEGRAIVRTMPNLPASIGKGVTGAVANAAASEPQRAMTSALLEAVGTVEWLAKEDDIEALMAISGCGPAYVFYLVECLAAAGAAMGLAPELAMRLARATVEGSGALLAADPQDAATLRQNVTSPGGTTAAALEVLMGEAALKPLIEQAARAAKRRSQELAG